MEILNSILLLFILFATILYIQSNRKFRVILEKEMQHNQEFREILLQILQLPFEQNLKSLQEEFKEFDVEFDDDPNKLH